MNKTQATLLFVAVLSFLVAIAELFFAATDSKSRVIFLLVAAFYVIVGTIWLYHFVKGKRTL
jgi:hypothetical protein